MALCHSREQAETVHAKLGVWLKDRGLTLNEEKTRIGRIDDGFDFLSFTIRRHYVQGGTRVLTKPSRDALKKIPRRIAAELRALRGANPIEVINAMNPIIRGQANCFRPRAPKRPTRPWTATCGSTSTREPPQAPQEEPTVGRGRYFGSFHQTRRHKWVYGDRETGAYLRQYAWTEIVRHVPHRQALTQ